MAKVIKKIDNNVREVLEAFRQRYGTTHPRAKIEAYRYNPGSIRVRILDPDFSGKSLGERENLLWPILESLPEDTRMQVSLLLLLTPKERQRSLGSMEFDDPTPSLL
jgi:hypothetical protein